MPFTPSPPTVALLTNAGNIPELSDSEKNNLPAEDSRGLIFKGGDGGDLGEKSYKPEIFYAKIDLVDNLGNIQLNQNKLVNNDEIKTENDAGYAIRLIEDGSNQCDLNINLYSQIPSINIYQTGSLFNYTSLASGVVSSSTTIYNDGSFGDFTLKVGAGGGGVTSINDTDLGLNKYYIDLKNGFANPSPQSDVIIGKQLNLTNLNNLFCFYVIELDYFDGDYSTNYSAYLTDTAVYDKNQNSIDLSSISTNDFANGDYLKISSEKDIYSAVGIYNAGKLTNVTFRNSSPSDFYAGASVGINVNTDGVDSPPDLKFCGFQTNFNINYPNSFFTQGGSNNEYDLGLHFKIDKKVSTSGKEISNVLFIDSDKFGLYQGATSPEPSALINLQKERIRNRSYITDQYGSDATKLIIKNKPKFTLIYHGIIKNANGYTYYLGNESGLIATNTVNISDPFFGITNPYLLVGNPNLKFTNAIHGIDDVRTYYQVKLYEVLVYKNLNFTNIYNPLDVVRASLINKYKQKLFIDASQEFLSSDMYYTYVDRLNILGKIKKT